MERKRRAVAALKSGDQLPSADVYQCWLIPVLGFVALPFPMSCVPV